MLIDEKEQKTNITFRNVEDFETYISVIDVDYDRGDVIFTGWLCKVYTPQLSMVKRSKYCKGAGFKQVVVETLDNSFYIPTSGNCFIKFNNY